MSMAIQKAITYAAIKHEGQKRKGTNIPYIIHPMEVMQILTAMDCSQDVIIAGILHDILEDTGTKPEEISLRVKINRKRGKSGNGQPLMSCKLQVRKQGLYVLPISSQILEVC